MEHPLCLLTFLSLLLPFLYSDHLAAETYTVSNVIDGDSLDLSSGEQVRLISGVELNLKSKKMTKWDVHDFHSLALSPDKRFILGWDKAEGYILSLLDAQSRERVPIKSFPSRPYIRDDFIWSPDMTHFVFAELRAWIDLILNFPMDFTADTPSIYVFSLNTGKAKKIIKLTDIHGGFWLPEDPLLK